MAKRNPRIGIKDYHRDTGFGEHKPLHEVLPALGDRRPLSVAVKKMQEQLEAGDTSTCPCCGQITKIYKRKLGGAMARGLIQLYHGFRNQKEPAPIHIAEFFQSLKNAPSSAKGGGDVAKLRYWKLLRRIVGEREDGSNRVGLYTMTKRGRAFVEGEIKVASHVHIYNGVVVGWSDTQIGIEQAIGKKFNYRELMAGRGYW